MWYFRIDDVEVSFGRALYDFQVAGQQHLSFSKGDIIEVTEKHLDGWWNGKTNKTTGIFPASFIEVGVYFLSWRLIV